MVEVEHAVLCERAVTLEDVLVRRLGLFFRASDQGLACAPLVAQRMAALLQRDDAWILHQTTQYEQLIQLCNAWRKESTPGVLVNVLLKKSNV